MVLSFFGREISLSDLRKQLGSGRDGTSATALLSVARTHGLKGRGVRVEAEDIDHLPIASILHWEFKHYVVFERSTRNSVWLVDPSCGARKVSKPHFSQAFTGIALVFEKTPDFSRKRQSGKWFERLAGILIAYKGVLAKLICLSLLVQALSAILPIITGRLIDHVIPNRDLALLAIMAEAYCLSQFVNAFVIFVREHLLIRLRIRLETKLTLEFVDHLVDLPYKFFQEHTSGDLLIRLGSNSVVRDILTSAVICTFMDGILASVYLVILALLNIRMMALVLAFAIARMVVLASIRMKQRQLLADTLENQAQSQTSQIEMLVGFETLKAMGLERKAAQKWSTLFNDGLNLSAKKASLEAISNSFLSAIGTVSILGLLFYGALLVIRGSLTLGTMITFNAMAAAFLNPLNNLVISGLQLQMLEIYVDRINDVLRTAPEQDDRRVIHIGELKGRILLDQVSFRYSEGSRLALNDVSFVVEPGFFVAIVGRTGSGKSSLAKLLAGLYSPSSGRILFDGRDLEVIDRRSLRRQLGIVTQEAHLFGGSIRSNIALGNSDAGIAEIERAAAIAEIHDDIFAMPMKYETLLSDRGLTLSGGQRQRLAIARAVAGYPKILILDEATSHLDAITEQKISDNLNTLSCSRVLIAHRLSTVKNADLIIVLEDGQIVEWGTHQDLLRRDSRYAILFGAQMNTPI